MYVSAFKAKPLGSAFHLLSSRKATAFPQEDKYDRELTLPVGYDSGIIGGVLTFTSFQHDFGYSDKQKTSVTALAVALQQLGGFLACFAIWPVTRRYGRKWALVVCSFIFCIGALIQTIKTESRSAFYVGRVIAGIGLGGSSVIVPMYSAEMAPAPLRGQIGVSCGCPEPTTQCNG